MKKKIICTIIAATIALLPTAAFAAAPGDVNDDGEVSYEDFNLIKSAVDSGKEIEATEANDINKDGKVDFFDLVALKDLLNHTNIKGDVNGDGIVDLSDKALFLKALKSGEMSPVFDADGKFLNITLENSQFAFDEDNADIDENGYINFQDFYEVKVPATNIKGDVNSDGVVNKRDLLLFHEYLLNNEYEVQYSGSDINGDGKLDNTDYNLLEELIKNN